MNLREHIESILSDKFEWDVLRAWPYAPDVLPEAIDHDILGLFDKVLQKLPEPTMVDRSDFVDAWKIAKIASMDEPESFRNAFIRAIQGNVRVPGVFAPVVLSRGWQGDLWSKHYLDLDPEGGKVLFHVGGVQSPRFCTVTIDSQCPTSQRHPYAHESDRMIERVYDDAIFCDHSVMMLHGTIVAHGGATQAALYRLGLDLESIIQETFRIASGGGYWFMEQGEDPAVEARKLWDRMRFVRWCLEQLYADQSKNSIGN